VSVVGALTLGGTLTVTNADALPLVSGDRFQLFSAASYTGNFAATNLPSLALGQGWLWTPTNGTLSVVTLVNVTPPTLTAVLTGTSLSLSWPEDHLGWFVQVQTNALAAGVGTNWVKLLGSDTVTVTNLPLGATNPAVFFRLTYP
jgi:hypothetical protein